MRARLPDRDGYVEREGVKVFYEVFGDGEPAILLLPAWSVVHSRSWKMQVPFLARHHRVITFDGRGNGRSDRPAGADIAFCVAAYTLGMPDDAMARTLDSEYLSRDPSLTRKAAYIQRTMSKARLWANR